MFRERAFQNTVLNVVHQIATAQFETQVHTQRVDSCESCSGGPRLRRISVVTFAVRGTAICGRSLFGDASGEFISALTSGAVDARASVQPRKYANGSTQPLYSLALLFEQLPCPAATMTLPDLSSSIPRFDGSRSHSVNMWLDDVRRVQQLASWDDTTTCIIAANKLKGMAQNWHLSFRNQYTSWAT
ncbi:hypothetical protein HPB52_007035 [Rhipicephalus sanguineus]|uniref:Retrotransposon gag domain-containing protein n=1 Tax=Rhipicephalus sanguineus TaxID=34632 RepID=A0A9D4T2X1_RHISA|nr:hypothetical protein HPB52_007035 [Rhipicephalus sanguineus]